MGHLSTRTILFGNHLKRHPLVLALLISLLAIINAYFHLRTPKDWWIEDDPVLYAAAAKSDHFINFFMNPSANEHGVGQNEMAQVLMASFWFDHFLAPRDARVSYWHSAIVYALSAGVFFCVLRRLLASTGVAFLGAVIWLSLPTTTVVVEFLSTRHYMYGMLFGLLSLELCERAIAAQTLWRRTIFYGLFAVSLAISLIAKELFPPMMLTFLFLRFAYRRVWIGCGLCVALAVGYAIYRFWMTDPALTYRGMPLPNFSDVFVFLSRLPYSFAANYSAYAFILLALGIHIRTFFINPSRRVPMMLFSVGFLAAIATVTPVMSALIVTWQTYGPWYRTPFVLHTLLLIIVLSAFISIPYPKLKSTLYAMLLLSCLAGGHRIARHWDRLKRAQRTEGEFYLSNPSKTLFTWTEAFWYFPGLQQLYPELKPAEHVSRWPSVSAAARERLLSLDTVWTMRDGKILPLTREQVAALLQAIP